MTYLIFIGDMLVMLFMIGVAIWFFYRENDEQVEQTANLPLIDDFYNQQDAAKENHRG
jgi:cbb3-type cytochrome oxidase subunit 3